VTVQIHGDRLGDRAVGKPRTLVAASRGDPTTVGGLARMAMLSRVWKLTPPVGGDINRAVYFLKARMPMAAAMLSKAAIAALTQPVPAGGCSWCLASLYSAAPDPVGEPPDDDDLYRSFLGSKCRRCRQRYRVAEAEQEALAEYQARVAAGVPPMVAARSRSRTEALARTEVIRELEQARPPTVPTGVITSAGGRRVPDPPYYRPRPTRWPADARWPQ
jgi:hypothetical protein